MRDKLLHSDKQPGDPSVRIFKSGDSTNQVIIAIDGTRWSISDRLARDMGDALFKIGSVNAHQEGSR